METFLSVLLSDKGHQVRKVEPHTTVFECSQRMKEHHIGALLVMEGQSLLGIISERDILYKIVTLGHNPKEVPVSAIMTRDLITVLPDTTVGRAMQLVTEKRIRHLPVVLNGELIGIISIGDLTRWAMLQQQEEISSLTRYVSGG